MVCSWLSVLGSSFFVLRSWVSMGSKHAAGDEERLAGDPGGIVGSEEDGDGADVIGLADAPQGCGGDDGLVKIGADEAGRMHALGFDHARVERIDADFAGAELLRERFREGIDRAFGGTVN